MVGWNNSGTLSQDYFTGTVEGLLAGPGGSPANNQVGGFVGQNAPNSNISNSYADATIDLASNVGGGGFAGVNQATISTSYAVPYFTGSYASQGNGFVYTSSVEGYSYSQTLNNDFYDTLHSPGTSGGGTGLSDSQMQAYTNFTGFGFTGATPTWAFTASGNGSYIYPVLTELTAGPYASVGNIYSGSIVNGSTYSGDSIALYVNGSTVSTSTVSGTGTFSFTVGSSLGTSTNFLVALTSGAAGGIVDTTLSTAGNITSLSLTVNDLIVGDSTNNSSFSNSSLASAVGTTTGYCIQRRVII
jgi:hypothetical protein